MAQLRTRPSAAAAEQASLRSRRRRRLRVLAAGVAVAAALGTGVAAVASGSTSVILAFHPIGWGGGAGPVQTKPVAGGGTPPCIPERRPVAASELQGLVPFHVLTVSAPAAVLTSATYSPAPCGGKGGTVELAYNYRGGSFVLVERAAPAGPLKVDLKEYAKDSWRVVSVDGQDYAVQLLAVQGRSGVSSVTVAEFKQGETRVDLTVGEKGGPYAPLSLAEFEALVRTIS
jgi:hypothetical protein